MADEIDVGTAAINRPATKAAGTTYVLLTNPANDNGWLTKVQIYAATALTGVKIGLIRSSGGTNGVCESVVTIGNSAQGYVEHSITPIVCQLGWYIAIYFATGTLDRTVTSGSLWTSAGDKLIEDLETTFAIDTNDVMSCYGKGDLVFPGGDQGGFSVAELSALGVI